MMLNTNPRSLPLVKRKGRNPISLLFPLVRKVRPRRCHLTGATEKTQTAYPPPWMNQHKDFLNPKKYPLEIDHINMEEWQARSWNLRWLSKLAHIETTKFHLFPYRRKIRRAASTMVIGYQEPY